MVLEYLEAKGKKHSRRRQQHRPPSVPPQDIMKEEDQPMDLDSDLYVDQGPAEQSPPGDLQVGIPFLFAFCMF